MKHLWYDSVIDQNGKPVIGATATVYLAGTGTKATIYSDNAGTEQDNPITSDSAGFVSCKLDPGEYDIVVAKGSSFISTIPGYVVDRAFDPSAVAITGGTIDGVTIGASAPGVVNATDINYSGEIRSLYSPEAVALFARMDEQLADDQKDYVNDWIIRAKPYLDKLDFFYTACFDTLNQNLSGGKLLCWTNAAYDADLHGTVNYLPNAGFNGNSTDFCIETHFLPGDGTKYQGDNALFGSVMQDTLGTGQLNRNLGGYISTSGYHTLIELPKTNTNQSKYRLNRNSSRTFTYNPMEPAHITAVQADGVNKLFKNTATLDNSAYTTPSDAGMTSGGFYLMAEYSQTTGAPVNFSGHTASAWYAGAAFTDEEVTDWYYLLNEFLAYFGAEDRVLRPYTYAVASLGPGNLQQGDTITYSITMRPSGTRTGSMTVAIEGDFTDADFDTPFLTALAAGVAGSTGVSLSGNVLTFTDDFVGPLTWSRTLTSTKSVGDVHAMRLSDAEGIYLDGPFACQVYGQPVLPDIPANLQGANLSGGEFGSPFYYGDDSLIEPYAQLGITVARLPCKWTRMQNELYGPIDADGQASQYKAGVLNLINRGIYVIIDPHDSGGYNGFKIGTPEVPVDAFCDFLGKFVDFLGPSPYLIYLLQNEPHGMDADTWRAAAKAGLDTIRARKANNVVQVPGTDYTSAARWTTDGNAERFIDFTDPVNNFTFDMHQYLDADAAGDDGACAIGSGSRLDAAITWCRDNGFKMFLGEFGCGKPDVSGQEQCGTELPAMLSALNGASDVCAGSTAWGGGPWWNSSYFMRFLDGDTNAVNAYSQMVIDSWE